MKDELEDFVRRNRSEFDDRDPSPRVWKNVESSLGLSAKPSRKPLVLWRAAAIFFMALSAYLLIPKQITTQENVVAMREFSDVEAFYTQEISNKMELIGEFEGSEGLNGFTHDFQQLEAMYHVLKEAMKSKPSQEVKDALVLNLLVQIDLLNQHIYKLEEKKAPKKKGDKST